MFNQLRILYVLGCFEYNNHLGVIYVPGVKFLLVENLLTRPLFLTDSPIRSIKQKDHSVSVEMFTCRYLRRINSPGTF